MQVKYVGACSSAGPWIPMAISGQPSVGCLFSLSPDGLWLPESRSDLGMLDPLRFAELPLCQTPVRHEDEVNLCGQ